MFELSVEYPMYGLGREGIATRDSVELGVLAGDTTYTRRLGQKLYELTDHLGNARGVISDRLLSDMVFGVPGKYRADIRRYSNMYAYGMEMPGRYYEGSKYRYGYNGMEQDSTSTGDHYTTYFRQYDGRLGRFWSIDPVTHPSESPYVAMGGNPIAMADPSGADPGGGVPQSGSTDGGTYGPPVPQGGEGRDHTTVYGPANIITYNEVIVEAPRMEGATKQRGIWPLNAIDVWHIGEQGGYWVYEDLYNEMLQPIVEIYPNRANPELYGFKSGVEYAPEFDERFQQLLIKRWGSAGPYLPKGDRPRNPYFQGHALISDPVGDLIASTIVSGGLGILGRWSTYVGSRFLASLDAAIAVQPVTVIYEQSAAASLKLLPAARPASLGGGTIFNHFTDANGIRGITGIVGSEMRVGQQVIVSELRFGRGLNSFQAASEGDIFVTDLEAGVQATQGQLQSIGVFGDRQNFVIRFSQETAIMQDIRLTRSRAGIFTMPGGTTLKGEFTVARIR